MFLYNFYVIGGLVLRTIGAVTISNDVNNNTFWITSNFLNSGTILQYFQNGDIYENGANGEYGENDYTIMANKTFIADYDDTPTPPGGGNGGYESGKVFLGRYDRISCGDGSPTYYGQYGSSEYSLDFSLAPNNEWNIPNEQLHIFNYNTRVGVTWYTDPSTDINNEFRWQVFQSENFEVFYPHVALNVDCTISTWLSIEHNISTYSSGSYDIMFPNTYRVFQYNLYENLRPHTNSTIYVLNTSELESIPYDSQNLILNVFVTFRLVNLENVIDGIMGDGYDEGYADGYGAGFNDGEAIGSVDQTTQFSVLMGTIADVPIIFLRRLFGYELFGINVFYAMCTIISLIVALSVFTLVRRIF